MYTLFLRNFIEKCDQLLCFGIVQESILLILKMRYLFLIRYIYTYFLCIYLLLMFNYEILVFSI